MNCLGFKGRGVKVKVATRSYIIAASGGIHIDRGTSKYCLVIFLLSY